MACLVLVAGLVAPARATAPAPVTQLDTTTTFVDLKADDGIKLGANVTVPKAPGVYPLIVFVAAWGGGDTQNIVPSWKLAARGYNVINYATRGFGDSGGEVDMAGPQDMRDLSTVIDWGLAHTSSNPAQIGVAGISYGAGIALLGTAYDSRIKAIVSMSGWSDFSQALYPGNTRDVGAATVLRASGTILGHSSLYSQGLFDDFWNNRNIPTLMDFAKARSPITFIGAIEKNHPAVLLEQSWDDVIFPPDPMIDFYNQYTGPKGLQFRPGDHASSETNALYGAENDNWNDVYRWMDAYVKGTDQSIAQQPPIEMIPRSSSGPGPYEYYKTWAAVSNKTQTYNLGPTSGFIRTGSLGSAKTTGWSTTITAGNNMLANAATPLLTYSLEALTGKPPTAWLPAVSRDNTAVWQTGNLSSPMKVRGAVKIHTTVTPAKAQGTVIGYLYDVDQLGTGSLISFGPWSWSTAQPKVPFTLDFALRATAYNVPAGHSLALVLSTSDVPLYSGTNVFGDPMTFTSPASNPSTVSIQAQN